MVTFQNERNQDISSENQGPGSMKKNIDRDQNVERNKLNNKETNRSQQDLNLNRSSQHNKIKPNDK